MTLEETHSELVSSQNFKVSCLCASQPGSYVTISLLNIFVPRTILFIKSIHTLNQFMYSAALSDASYPLFICVLRHEIFLFGLVHSSSNLPLPRLGFRLPYLIIFCLGFIKTASPTSLITDNKL